MIKVLFLDDERNPIDVTWVRFPEGTEFKVVRSFQEFLAAVEADNVYDAWSLDHDLGENGLGSPKLSGYDALKAAICWHEDKLPDQVISHSQNPIGKRNIIEYWRNYVSNWD